MVCGQESVPVAPPFPFPLSALSQYAGTYPECSEISIALRNYLDGSTGRYHIAYPYTERSRGPVTCRTRTSLCRWWPRLRDVHRTVFSSLTDFLAMGVLFTARVTFQLLCLRWVAIVIQSEAAGASRDIPFILLLLPFVY